MHAYTIFPWMKVIIYWKTHNFMDHSERQKCYQWMTRCQFGRFIQISERLKWGKKKKKKPTTVSENNGMWCLLVLTGSLCKVYFLLGPGQWSLQTSILCGGEGDWVIYTVARVARGVQSGQPMSVLNHRQSGLSAGCKVPGDPLLGQSRSNEAPGYPTPCPGQALMKVHGISRMPSRGIPFSGWCYMKIRPWPDSVM